MKLSKRHYTCPKEHLEQSSVKSFEILYFSWAWVKYCWLVLSTLTEFYLSWTTLNESFFQFSFHFYHFFGKFRWLVLSELLFLCMPRNIFTKKKQRFLKNHFFFSRSENRFWLVSWKLNFICLGETFGQKRLLFKTNSNFSKFSLHLNDTLKAFNTRTVF